MTAAVVLTAALALAYMNRLYYLMNVAGWRQAVDGRAGQASRGYGFDESIYAESGLYLPENDPRAVNAKLDFDPIHGVNLPSHLATNATPKPPRPLFWRHGPYRALRDDYCKLIVSERPKKDWLFTLAKEPTEKLNLAAQRPERLKTMKATLQAHHANMPPSLWPSFLEGPVLIDKTRDQKESPDDEYTHWVN